MQDTSVYFRADIDTIAKFNSIVKLERLNNKTVYNAFLKIFNENPQETLKFLKIK